MRSESSNYKLGRLDKVLVLKFVLTQTNPDTEFKMVRGRTIKTLEFYILNMGQQLSIEILKILKYFLAFEF